MKKEQRTETSLSKIEICFELGLRPLEGVLVLSEMLFDHWKVRQANAEFVREEQTKDEWRA